MNYCKIEKDVKEQYDGKFPVCVEIDVEPPCISLNRKEAAQFLGISVYTLRSWHSTKKYSLPFTKRDRDIRYLLSDLEEFKVRHRQIKYFLFEGTLHSRPGRYR